MGEEVFTVITKRLVELKDEDLHSLLSRDVGIQDILPYQQMDVISHLNPALQI